jgi:beta-lactamase class A
MPVAATTDPTHTQSPTSRPQRRLLTAGPDQLITAAPKRGVCSPISASRVSTMSAEPVRLTSPTTVTVADKAKNPKPDNLAGQLDEELSQAASATKPGLTPRPAAVVREGRIEDQISGPAGTISSLTSTWTNDLHTLATSSTHPRNPAPVDCQPHHFLDPLEPVMGVPGLRQTARLLVAAAVVVAITLAGVVPASAAPPQARAWAQLQRDLDGAVEQAAAAGVTMSVTVVGLANRYGCQTLRAGADERLKAASVIKLAILAQLMNRVDKGTLSLDTVVTIPAGSSNIVGGSGTLRNRQFPLDISIRELMELMVQVSDNTATNVLIDVAGGFDAVNAYIRGLGFNDLYLGRKMIHPAVPPLQENYITASEVTRLLVMIWNGEILSRESSDHIISLMKGQLVNTKYGAVIPREHLANKTGELDDVSHDSGYITLPGREVALTTTTAFTGIPRSEADKFVQQTATIVYEFTKQELPGDQGKRPAHSYTTGKPSCER